MAAPIKDKLYQVALGTRWNFEFVQAKDEEDLIRYLVEHYPDRSQVYGANEIWPDGSYHTAKIISHPLFEELYARQEAMGIAMDLPAGVTMIDGKPWAVMLPKAEATPEKPNDFDLLRAAAKVHSTPTHFVGCASWAAEGVVQPEYGFLKVESQESRVDFVGFRPILVPLDPKTFEPSSSYFLGREDGDLFRFGSLYMDTNPLVNPADHYSDQEREADLPDYTPGSKLHIGNSSRNADHLITWVKTGNALIANCNLIKNISWADLDRMGLARGPEHLREQAHPSLDRVLADAKERATQNDRERNDTNWSTDLNSKIRKEQERCTGAKAENFTPKQPER